MLLRRITKHVTDQNWFAVFIDFLIVVVGVFIGIQVANWNETQTNKVGLNATLERLNNEVSQNIKITQDILSHFEDGQADMTKGREALNACSYSPEAQAALERLLFDLVNDTQPNFATVVQDQLARQDHYQVLMSEDFQAAFGAYASKIKEEHEQLKSHYENMWAHHINYHPSVSANFSGEAGENLTYAGWGFKLGKPFEEVCKDASFRNRFINTIGFYTSIHQRLIFFKIQAKEFQEYLGSELESK